MAQGRLLLETIRRQKKPLATEYQQPDDTKRNADENLPDKGASHDARHSRTKARRQTHDKHGEEQRNENEDGNAQHVPAPPGWPGPFPRLVDIYHLAGVHDVPGIDGPLDHAHQGVGVAMLGLHVFLLSEPDAVLARHRPAEFDRHQVECLG